MLSVNLCDLNTPYKLSTWLQSLPSAKQRYLQQRAQQSPNDENKEDKDDRIICDKLAIFAFENGLIGHHLMNNFSNTDFEQIVSLLEIENAKDKSQWIWQCIEHSQQQQQQQQQSHVHSESKLQWVINSWTQVQILRTPIHEEPPTSISTQIPPVNDSEVDEKSERAEPAQEKQPEEESKYDADTATLTNSEKDELRAPKQQKQKGPDEHETSSTPSQREKSRQETNSQTEKSKEKVPRNANVENRNTAQSQRDADDANICSDCTIL